MELVLLVPLVLGLVGSEAASLCLWRGVRGLFLQCLFFSPIRPGRLETSPSLYQVQIRPWMAEFRRFCSALTRGSAKLLDNPLFSAAPGLLRAMWLPPRAPTATGWVSVFCPHKSPLFGLISCISSEASLGLRWGRAPELALCGEALSSAASGHI